MASELYVETLKGLTSGANANKIVIPSGQTLVAPGHVIQVVQTVYDTSTTITGTTAVDTGLTATITPASTSSKILVIADISCSGSNGNYVFLEAVRNSTTLYQGSESKTWVGSKILYPVATGGEDGLAMFQASVVYLDSPSTTSATTYKIQGRTSNASATFGVNRRTSADDTSTASSLTLMEIAG